MSGALQQSATPSPLRLWQRGYSARLTRGGRLPSAAAGACLLLGLLVTCAPGRTRAQIRDPHLVWHTLETDHFSIHYHEPLGMLARKVAATSERAHTLLSEELDYELPERVHVVLTDQTDSANGSARPIPYDRVRLFAAAPDDFSTLGDYDDWMTLLVTHEHTHILHFDQISGLPAVINTIFGKTYAPNIIQPRWFIEGLATYEESLHTSGGRVRGSLFDMYLRMDALEGRLLELDQLSNPALRWPHGTSYYLYGSHFVEHIAEQHGRDVLYRIGKSYGGEAIPYGINRVARRATGHGFVELYEDFLNSQRRQAEETRARIRAQGLVQGERLTHHGEVSRYPTFLPDGRILYYAADARVHGMLRAIEPRTGENPEEIVRVDGTSVASLHPDGEHLIYDGLAPYRDIYDFNDLFLYDLTTGETRRLTHGLRARSPSVSPDGRRVAFVTQAAGTSELELAELYDVEGTRRVLVPSGPYEQAFTPRWSPDGERIAFSAWRTGGKRDLFLVHPASGDVQRITDDRALDMGPTWTPDGRYLLFSSDRTGISNIYAYDTANQRLLQVTNVLGGAFQPAVSPDGGSLVYVGYTSYGYDLYRMPLDPDAFRPAPPSSLRRPDPVEPPETPPLRSEPYDPLPTLRPYNYELDMRPDDFGQQLGLTVAGQDAAAFHDYAARVAVGLERGDPTGTLRYSYLRLPTALSLQLFRDVDRRTDLHIGGRSRAWIEEAWGMTISASYTFPGLFSTETVSLSYSALYIDNLEPFRGRLDPNDPPPSLPRTELWIPSVRLSWNHSNAEKNTYDVTRSRGHRVRFSIDVADPSIGSPTRSIALRWSGRQYVPVPWSKIQVLALGYTGGISGGTGRLTSFSVGGFPNKAVLNTVVDSLFTSGPSLLGGVALRGYPPNDRRGRQYHVLQAEYRFPIWRANQGVITLPVFLERVYGNVFVDYGDAFTGEIDISRFRMGVGGELLTEVTLGYVVPFTFRLGLARGLMQGGVTQTYFHLGAPF